MKLLSIRSMLIVALTLNFLTACGGSGGSPLGIGSQPETDPDNPGSGEEVIIPQPPEVVETDLEKALRTGDARVLDNNEILLNTALQTIQTNVDHFDQIKAALFGKGEQALTQLSWNPSHDSSLIQSQYPFNDVVLYTNSTFKEGNQIRHLPIAIAGNGSTLSDETRYLVFGGNPLRTSHNS